MKEILQKIDNEFSKETDIRNLGKTWCELNKEVEKIFTKHLERIIEINSDDGK